MTPVSDKFKKVGPPPQRRPSEVELKFLSVRHLLIKHNARNLCPRCNGWVIEPSIEAGGQRWCLACWEKEQPSRLFQT